MRSLSISALAVLLICLFLAYPVWAAESLTYVPITYVKTLISAPYTVVNINSVDITSNGATLSLSSVGEGVSGFYIGYFYDQHPWVDSPYQTLGPSLSGGDIYGEVGVKITDITPSSTLEWARVAIVNAFWRGQGDKAEQYMDKTWYLHNELDIYDLNYPDRSDKSVAGYHATYWTINVRILKVDSLGKGQLGQYKFDFSDLNNQVYADQAWIGNNDGYLQCVFIAIELKGVGSISLEISNFNVYREPLTNLVFVELIVAVTIAVAITVVWLRRHSMK